MMSAEEVHAVDPDGDALLIVPRTKTSEASVDGDEDSIHFLVSSKHLTLASAYSKALFSAEWRHGQQLSTCGSVPLRLKNTSHDSETMRIILNVVHGRQRQVPFTVSEKLLLKVALATDYFMCGEAMQAWGLYCTKELVGQFPSTYSSRTWTWIFISYVFGWDSFFRHLTKLVQQSSTEDAYSGSLPIPKWIPDQIFAKRREYLEQVFELIDARLEEPLSPTDICNESCDALKAGTLRKYVRKHQQRSIQDSPLSFVSAIRTWKNPEHLGMSRSYHIPCASGGLLGLMLETHLDSLSATLSGIEGLPKPKDDER